MLGDDLRATFLFEKLSDEQLYTLTELGAEVAFLAGETVFIEGQAAEFLWVLLDGELELTRHVGGQRVVIATVSRPGSYAGGIRAFAGSGVGGGYRATGRTLRPSRFFRLPSGDLDGLLSAWSPMAKHLLDGYLQRLEGIEATVRERERLISLGTLAAGLTHELNNPAAAAMRAAADLRRAVGQLQSVVEWLSRGEMTLDQVRAVLDLRAGAAGQTANAPALTAIETANREDEIGTWLEEHEVENPWDLASTFVAGGLDLSWLEQAASALGSSALSHGLNWIAGALTAESLLDQLDDATGRISRLVSAVKDYSYVDRTGEQEIDIHEGIEKTLVILEHKLRPGIEIVRDYGEDLPRIEANGGELNQVWTNLIDNAIDAMSGHGQIHIRTRRDGDAVLVEIGDQGPGVPQELASRIFDPFFTTKEVGKGTGLGLDIVRRLVVERHRGDVALESVPGDTRFQVRLPITARPA